MPKYDSITVPETPSVSSYASFQVWALQEGSTVHLGGKTNRAKYTFQDELNEIVDSIPEVKATEQAKEAAGASSKST